MVSAVTRRDQACAIVGDAHVHDADERDAVAGVIPSLVVAPADEEQVAAVLAWATRESLRVVVRGGSTKLRWGAPPRGCDVVLSTARLDALVEHEPGDLVCVAQAGMPLAALQQALAPHRQALMLDPGHGVAATLGGIVAANAWGPLRTGYGTARDLVIGARFVLADGTVGHSGGKVVKNVAGYDVAKLLIGSLGTLAVVTQVSLRLHPLPRASHTVAFDGLTADTVQAAWHAVEGAPVAAAKVALLWPERTMLVRVDGTEEGAAQQAETLCTLRPGDTAAPPPPRMLSDDEADAAWDHAATAVWSGNPDIAVAACAVPRSELRGLVHHLGHAAERAVVLPSLGVAEAVLPADALPAEVAALRQWAEGVGGHVVLRRPSVALAAGSATWPKGDAVAVELMRAVKRSFDPAGTLAPGRHLGGI